MKSENWGDYSRGNEREDGRTETTTGPLGRLIKGKKPNVEIYTSYVGGDRGEIEESYEPGVKDKVVAVGENIKDSLNLKKKVKKLWGQAIERRIGESKELKKAREKAQVANKMRSGGPTTRRDEAVAAMIELKANESICETEGVIMTRLGLRPDPRDYKQAIYNMIVSDPTRYGIRGAGYQRDYQIDSLANRMARNIHQEAKRVEFKARTGAEF